MALIRSGSRYAHTLFNVGSVGGLTDGELLGLFISPGRSGGACVHSPGRSTGPMVMHSLPVDPAG